MAKMTTTNDEFKQPLLLNMKLARHNDETENDIDDDDNSHNTAESEIHVRFCLTGIILGMVVQIVDITVTRYMILRWGDAPIDQNNDDDWLLHLVLMVFSQADLYLYAAMWIMIIALQTQTGLKFVRMQMEEGVVPSNRSIFIMAMNFYAGIILGVFFGWSIMDAILGFPLSFLPMICVLLFGFMVLYIMIYAYDEFNTDDFDQDPTTMKNKSIDTAVAIV